MLSLNTGIESHAGYQIADQGNPPQATPLWWIAKEVGQAIDDLNQESTAPCASQWLLVLLRRTPALLLTAIPALIQKLRDGGRIAAATSSLLHDLGPPALKALVANLSCRDPRLRGAIATAVGTFGPAAGEALPVLEELLQDEPLVRVSAAIAIWRIDGRIAELAPIVMEGLKMDGPGWAAAACLREMGPDAGGVIPALVELLRDGRDSRSRAQAVVALGGMGLEAAPAVPFLLEAAMEANDELRGFALEALRELRALARTADVILLEFGGAADQVL